MLLSSYSALWRDSALRFLLPVVDWSRAPTGAYLGGQEAFIYTLLTLLFLGCLLTTAFIPEERGGRGEDRKTGSGRPLKSWWSICCPHLFLPRPQCAHLTMGRCVSACMSVLPPVYGGCICMPAVIRRLFVAKLFNWMALMTVMLFYADFMGQGLYQGVPSAKPESQERQHYDEGVGMASLGLFLQCAVSMLCSVVMDHWVSRLGAKAVYSSNAALLVFATAVMTVSKSVLVVTSMAALTGYSLCVLHVLPYTLLCLYHSDRQASRRFSTSSQLPPHQLSKHTGVSTSLLPSDVTTHHGNGHPGDATLSGEAPHGSPHASLLLERDGGEGDSIPVSQRGMCFDMAILDSAYLLSQVLLAMCLGSIVQLANSVRAYMASACCFSLLAFLCSTGVVYNHADLQR